MSSLNQLEQEKQRKIQEKNKILKEKYFVEDNLVSVRKDMATYTRKNDFLSFNKFKIEEKELKKTLKVLNNELTKITLDLVDLNKQIEYYELRKINKEFISKENLSEKEIKSLENTSKKLSNNFKSLINKYSAFFKKINLMLGKLDDKVDKSSLNLLKVKLEYKKQDLENYQKQCIEFKLLDNLSITIVEEENYLKNLMSQFDKSENLFKEFNKVLNNYSKFYYDLVIINNRYGFEDLKQLDVELKDKMSHLIKYQMECFDFDCYDRLCEVVYDAKKNLSIIKDNFENSKNIIKKFINIIEYYYTFLSKVNSSMNRISDNYDNDSLKELNIELKNRIKNLKFYKSQTFNFKLLDELNVMVIDAKKDLNHIRVDFRNNMDKSEKLSREFKSLINEYSKLLLFIDSDWTKNDEEYMNNELMLTFEEIEVKKNDLSNFHKKCFKFNAFNELNNVIYTARRDLKNIVYNLYHKKIVEYNDKKLKLKLLINESEKINSKLNSKLTIMIRDTHEFSSLIDKTTLLNNLNELKRVLTIKFNNLNYIKKASEDEIFEQILNIPLISDGDLNNLKNSIDKVNSLNFNDLEININKQQEVYKNLSNLNEDINSKGIESLLKELELCFKRGIFMRQLKKYNLQTNELNIIKEDIKTDIINQVITDENTDFKKLIKTRCKEFRKDNSDFDENEINAVLDSIALYETDKDIIHECKDKVKIEFLKGNVSINQVEFKLKSYVTKKVNESNQLKDLEWIKKSPDVPSIKIHLTKEEINEIYRTTENEIRSEYGIRDNVENRVSFWANKKIRENQSEARNRLNIIKRDFSSLTDLNNKQQIEFVNQIEFYINNHKIKYYDITEEYIISLSDDFINNGKIKLR